MPHNESNSKTVYQLIKDELMLDGNSRQNLATFCQTFAEDEIHKLMEDCLDKNMIDKILNTIKECYSSERVTDIDGVKIDFDAKKTWVHLRKSNTEPIIRIYAEGPTQEEADKLAQTIISQINTIIG